MRGQRAFPAPFVDNSKPLRERRVALIMASGLHRRDDDAFAMMDSSYRVIPGHLKGDESVMSHSSVNVDRGGFQEDLNVVFPIDRFRELVTEGQIGSLASQPGARTYRVAQATPARNRTGACHVGAV